MIVTALVIAAVILLFALGGPALDRYLDTHIPIDLDALDRPRSDRNQS